jgi:predicted DNA-binding protein YlxM (UPF0122 family)
MKEFSKEYLEDLASKMSLSEMARQLKIPKSTIYYNLKKLGIVCRTRSEAQKLHIKNNGHQRIGHQHSDAAKQQISNTSREFWDSSEGEKQKVALAKLREQEWKNTESKNKRNKISQLRDAPRPKAGSLSKFGTLLADFLKEHGHKISTCKGLTNDHVSDIILENEQIVIELIPPIDVFGPEAEEKLTQRYLRLVDALNAMKYNVLVVQQLSNSISRARCQRVYEEILSFKGKSKIIKS